MPIYDYRCPNCDKVKEEMHGILERPIVKCYCGKRMVKQCGLKGVVWDKPPDTASAGRECN